MPVVQIDPCWSRCPDRAVSVCTVTLDIGGSVLEARAEFTEKEEQGTKGLATLKHKRIIEALAALRKQVAEQMHG